MVARVRVHRASLMEEGQTPSGRPSRSPLRFFPALPIGKREAASFEGVAELLERIWPDAMELFDLGLAEPG